MKKRIQTKLVLTCTAYLAFLLAFTQFLSVYSVDNQLGKYFSIGFISLTVLIIPSKIFRFFFYLLSFFLSLLSFYPFTDGEFTVWVQRLMSQVSQIPQLFINRGVGGQYTMTVIFILLIVTILLMELLVEYERIGLSMGMLVLYLLMLAVYNNQDFFVPVICIIGIGIFQNYYVNRWQEAAKLKTKGALQIIFLISATTLLSIYLPTSFLSGLFTEQSTSFRNFLNEKGLYSYIQKSGLQLARTGFSENDETLGGPILEDTKIVFEAFQETAHYWRIDSKDFYTGVGWRESPEKQNTPLVDVPSATEMLVTFPGFRGAFDSEEKISLAFEQVDAYIPLPYGETKVSIQSGGNGFEYNPESGRLNIKNYSNASDYQMIWKNPTYTVEELRAVGDDLPDDASAYLQVPSDLPQRVVSLASKFAEGKTSRVDKVTAIETYLKESGKYRYSKIDAVFTKEGQDYVDQFLFDSKVGYCDNFSTAMAVMLRSLGVPARWVKGYAPGEQSLVNEQRKYTIRNNDAHSWVEVYFEGYGWLPFEPTPSFTQPLRVMPEKVNSDTSSSHPQESTVQESERETKTTSTTSSVAKTPTEPSKETPTTDSDAISVNWLFLGLFLLVVTGGFLLYRWSIYLTVLLMCFFTSDPIKHVYPYLLKKVNVVLNRSDSCPLQEYAAEVEKKIPAFHQTFSQLTQEYESYLYSNQKEKTGHQILLMKNAAKNICRWRFKQLFSISKK